MSGIAKSIAAIIAANIRFLTGLMLLIGTSVIIMLNFDADSKNTIGIIAGYVNLVAYIPYFVSIVKGETKPSRTTWWIWSALEIMLSASYIMSGAGNTKWLPIASIIGMFLVAILSVWYGKKCWTIVDTTCSVGSIIGMVVWAISGNPLVALCCFLFVDLLAAIPTFIKSWEKPAEEDLLAWLVTLLSGIVNIFAIDMWSFSISILPFYYLAIYAVIVFILIFSKRR